MSDNSEPLKMAPASSKCVRFSVTGRVQGVWFRQSTQRKAEDLGLNGHAINLQDGSVEVLVSGGAVEVDKLAAWLQNGPPMARVAQVNAEELPDPGITGFTTR